ncbi:Hpt domain-containing protein [Roseimicrobium gellanilyticum]|uniref:Hpt domain-containing protein n=1 Tax=Roseimicrobium gellanilyticum TaxID=748857 RepID=A0A366HDI4_9BACT|nr:Hpt domain-containing protein [Roseimicrobium gellanilyticum]RBP39785.1 Hpt domain-containing protein [Roseimicrobium gellanilyticum]
MSTADHATIDDELFESCLTGEPELDLELVQLAMTQSEEALAGLKHALRTGSDSDWRQISHRARGSAGTMGFTKAAFLWNVAEFEATTTEARAAAVASLRQAVEEVRAELRMRGYEIPNAPISAG